MTLATDPDYEVQSQYSFAVIATDAAGNASTAQSVTLEINNLDDTAPIITSGATAAAIDENSGAGQVVYTATADDSADISAGVSFSLADGSDAGLTIDTATGEVTLTADPDYEAQSQYSFAVIATDAAGNASIAQSVTLDINNLDDTAPIITSGATAAAIDENSGAGQVVYTATADDSADISAGVSFSLTDGSDAALSIDAATGEVTLATDPDFEAQSQYSFAVIATDAAGNASAAQSVTLDINNLDEVAPTITSGATAAAIDENSGAGQVVYTATADDSADISAGVSFSLAAGSDAALSIDAATGEVTLATDPDHEVQSQYSFAVIATDAAGNASAAQSVTIDINDLDDTAPTITSGDVVDTVTENTSSGQLVYMATADDSADVTSGPVIFSLSLDSDDALSIDPATGQVTLEEDPDHEAQTQYNFSVIATDGAGNFSEKALTLNIEDIDDVAPLYLSSSNTTVEENAGVGQVVYTAVVDDSLDVSDGVTFSLLPGHDAALSIDPISGEVTLNENPDFEAKTEYAFTVLAENNPNLASVLQVILTVENQDDTAPTISSDTSSNIDETNTAGVIIYTAVADDSADIDSGEITYSLAEGHDPALSINAVTGEVILANNLDYEAQNQYIFSVIATDAAGNVSEAQAVTVNLNNLDDTPAVITSAATAAAIDENSGAGQVIYTATADDSADVSDGVTFSLADGSDAALSIDANSGEVTLTVDPDNEVQQQYSFAVIATDAAGNSSAAQSVTLDINDLDDSAPIITSGDTAVAIDENSGAGQVIYTATADDSADLSDSISFSLAVGSDAGLTIDSATGEVSLTDDPDHEAQGQYSFAVIATDAAGNASEAKAVTLNINDLDETAPTFNSSNTASILESTVGNNIVYRAVVSDNQDISAGISFELSEDSDDGLSINAAGEVVLAPVPNFEAKSSYEFTVIASDGVNQTQQTVTLSIIDQDLDAPIAISLDTATIDENIGDGQIIYSAVFQDESIISYSLAEGYDEGLSIDSVSGAVTLATNPDHEVKANYNFTVVATDTSNNVAQQSVVVSINDLDDAAPNITSGAAIASIDENSGAGLAIYTATAEDAGDDISGGVTFALAEGSDTSLSIDTVTGVVSLNDNPDFEGQSQYSFTVVAVDAAGNESAGQSITLDINNLDDTAPIISSGVTVDAIDENTVAGPVIYTATATDVGDDSDGSVTYSLAVGSDAGLSINESTGEVTLTESPNFEVKSQYNFTVVATDSAGNQDQRELTLNINNIDERVPVFTSLDEATVLDGTASGSVVYRAYAEDSNDISAGVTYSFGSNDDALTIDPNTGEVTVNEDIDFAAQSSYSFSVLANDGVQIAFQMVTLDVVDQDLEDPVIISLETAAINENIGADQVIYTAISQDESVVSYSLSAGHDAGLSIDSVTGEVSLSIDPDHEIKTDYSFTVVAEDTAGNSAQKAITVTVTDLDDADPVITSGAIAAAIDENSGAGQVIYTAVADDSADISGGVTYSLSDDSDPSLLINASSGQVSLIDNPNYEVQAQYSFTVIATDAAGNESAGQPVTLDINNLDDTQPSITSDETVNAVDENSGADQVIYTAAAEDIGDTTDGVVSFSLGLDSDDGLAIDVVTGEVSLADNPDFEAKSQYSFTVVATDNAGNQDEKQLTLNINNLDELAPTFNSLVNASVLESTPSGSIVYRTLVDDSADTSAGVNFSLSEDSDEALSINSETGEVTLNEVLDYAAQSIYNFTVIADDGVNQSQQAVTLSVIDQDLEPPEFTSATTGDIDENIGENQVIYTALTNDESIVTYSLTEDSDSNLIIDSSTGGVTLQVNPDYEQVNQYSFTVMAEDTMGNQSDPHSVVINVNNLDDTPAVITSSDTVDAIDENSGAGQVIYIATADDSADVSGGFSFALTESSDDALSIDENTGEVTLSVDPNFEDQSQFNFAVIVTDAAGNVSLEKPLVLNINNVDDTVPFISSASTATDLVEGTGVNQVIYTASADDSADVSDGVTFSMATDDDSLSINELSGEVSLSDNPNYVEKSSYEFTITATDAAGNASASQAVTLAILETAPPQPVISLDSDTGYAADDSISQAGLVNVSNLKIGATWEYSLDDGESWLDGVGASFSIDSDGTYQVKVRQTNASETFTTSMENALEVKIDNAVPQVQSIAADSSIDKVVITYNEPLDATAVPLISDYEVTRNGDALVIDSIAIVGSTVELGVSDLESGSLQVKYTPSAAPNLIKDLAGNELSDGFSQIIVSDGYIRGAEVYEDVNNDGIAQESERLEGVTSDEFGQIILGAQYADSQIIVKGGINMDSGATNELELTAPAGYAVINPLTTLVQEIVSSTSGDDELSGAELEAAVAAAEQEVSQSLGIELSEGEDLSTYDPLSDQSIDNQKVVAQIATVLAVASAADEAVTDGSSNAEATALANLAEIVTTSEGAVELDAQVVTNILKDDNDVSLVGNLTRLTNAVIEMDQATTIEAVVEAQALVIDDIRPNAPTPELAVESNLGISNSDALTSDNSPKIRLTFDTEKNDGTAVVEGDILEIYNTGVTIGDPIKLTASHIENGYYDFTLSNENSDAGGLADGEHLVSASITDRAGNMSYVSNLKFEVDTSPLTFVDKAIELVAENAGESQVIYQAEVVEEDGWKFELSDDSDPALTINQDTGVVRVNHNPDFETQSSYSFTVIATDKAGNTSSQSINAGIVNLDEIAPTITSGATAAAIDENSGAGQVVYTATADDSADISAGVSFSLADGSDAALSIDTATGEVTLATDPDFEAQSQYSFAVIATDAAGNASAAQSVTLDINNLDEVAPTITSGATAAAIDENSGAGQVIYTATADDSADISAGVSFSLPDGSDAGLTIDTATGEVSLTADPDYEAQSQYSFAVIATDAAGNASIAQSVTLDINNLDDTAPIITSGATAAAIDENSGAGQVVYTATADDSADISAGVSFSLTDGSDAALSIDAATGEVTLATDPDFEAQSQYSFAVIATDAAGNASAAQSVTLDINNLDEVAPTITSGATAAAIDENSGAGQVVYTATADDSADISAGVSFSLTDGSDAALSIDAATGEVTLATDPDFEAQSQYSFAVIATDAAGNASAAQSVTLDINNLDEVAPTITSGATAAAIDENSGAGQVVYTATADDSADISAGVSFSLAAGSDAALSIDTATGEVTLATDPDYEVQSQYSFAVIATDAAGNASTAQSVTLEINNLDDTAPIITSGATAAAIDENSGAGQVVYTATALDNDSDLTSEPLTFSLSDDSNGTFSIDSVTGEVTLNNGLDGDNNNLYNFTVVATDSQSNQSSQIVSLSVNNIDDTAPIITSGDTATSVVENTGIGQVVYTVTADDSADVTDGAALTYGLAGADADAFSIDSLSGAVTLNVAPNYEAQNTYSFIVTATDSQGLVGEKTVTMAVGNVIDDAPTFSSGAISEVEENIGAGQIIYTAVANSDGENSDVTYSITPNNVHYYETGAIVQNFVVNDQGGYSMQLSIDPEVALAENNSLQNYNMDIVYDTDEIGQLTQDNIIFLQEKLYIPILNIVDSVVSVGAIHVVFDFSGPEVVEETLNISNQPTILTVDFTFNTGVTSAGFDITTITINETIEQRQPSSARLFEDVALSIDENTGEVTLLSNPDFEAQSAYSFTVTATDDMGSTDQTILVNVLDRDDSAPTVISSGAADAIDENSGAGQVVYTALSNFEGSTFSLTDDANGLFSIDANTGEVTLSDNPNFESLASYNFTVIATFQEFDSPERPVTLTINNLDEVAPTITSGDIAEVIDENTGAGQVIYTAAADDSADISAGVSFSLAEGSDAGLNIDSVSGEASLSTNPDFEAQSQYSFTVIADDGVNTPAQQSVTLDINNLDDAAPTITSGDAVIIDENSGAGQVVYTATANDSADVSGGITFALAEGSDPALSIDQNSGEVILADDPDFEIQGQYSFAVVATDAAGNASDAKAVTLSIDDIDESPSITSDEFGVILQGQGSDQAVYIATSNIDGATYSLVDYTNYSATGQTSEPAVTVISEPEQLPTTQHVYISDSQISEDGSQVAVTYSYKSDDSTTTGVGFSVGFDASILNFAQVSNVFSGAIAGGVLNDDGNSLNFAWASLFGAFPGSNKVDLATITFDIDSSASDYAQLDVVKNSGMTGFDFDGQSQQIAVVASSGDTSDSSDSAQSVVTVPDQLADTQHVYVSESTKSEDGTQVTVKLSYMADSASLTGVGFSLNFDNTVLSLSEVSNVLGGAIADGDINNDGDGLAFGWASLFGGWPGSNTAELATITFDIAEGATGSTGLNIQQTSTAAGYAFDGQFHDVIISAEADPQPTASQLSIDNISGVVTLAGDADYQTTANYNFTITADNGTESASQDVGLLVADYVVSSAFDSSTGTDESDIFVLTDGSADITSGAGEDIFILIPPSNEEIDLSAIHTLVDFESGVDSIDMTAALASVGYTGDNLARLSSDNIPTDILDLISGSDGSLDNLFGGTFDDTSKVLTLFADTNPDQGATEVEALQVKLGDDSSLDEDDDITVDFIA